MFMKIKFIYCIGLLITSIIALIFSLILFGNISNTEVLINKDCWLFVLGIILCIFGVIGVVYCSAFFATSLIKIEKSEDVKEKI